MRRTPSLETTALVAVAVTLLLAGCVGAPGQGTTAPESAATAGETHPPLEELPSPAACLTDAAPHPEPVDGVEPSAYPEPPTNASRAAVVGWVRSFETAYFRNGVLADADHDDMNLTSVSASAEVRGVNRTRAGYVLRFSDFGASNYASGIHGDHWADVGYVVTETRLVRVPLDDRSDAVRASDGTPVVDCR